MRDIWDGVFYVHCFSMGFSRSVRIPWESSSTRLVSGSIPWPAGSSAPSSGITVNASKPEFEVSQLTCHEALGCNSVMFIYMYRKLQLPAFVGTNWPSSECHLGSVYIQYLRHYWLHACILWLIRKLQRIRTYGHKGKNHRINVVVYNA